MNSQKTDAVVVVNLNNVTMNKYLFLIPIKHLQCFQTLKIFHKDDKKKLHKVNVMNYTVTWNSF